MTRPNWLNRLQRRIGQFEHHGRLRLHARLGCMYITPSFGTAIEAARPLPTEFMRNRRTGIQCRQCHHRRQQTPVAVPPQVIRVHGQTFKTGTPQRHLGAASKAEHQAHNVHKGNQEKESEKLKLKPAQWPCHGGCANRLAPPCPRWLFLTSGRWCCAAFYYPNAPARHSRG